MNSAAVWPAAPRVREENKMTVSGIEKHIRHIESCLGHVFKNRALLTEALCHRSFVNEHADEGICDNERLELLGDAVVNLAVAHILMQAYPDIKEGDLSRLRAALVNESHLATVARNLSLGRAVLLGRGEARTGGADKNSILADTFEALMAAVYLDGGFKRAFAVIETLFTALPHPVGPALQQDYKSQLQEHVQRNGRPVPCYTVVGQSGPDHDKTFTVQLRVQTLITEGRGKSKKLAEQDAARQALEKLAMR